MQRVEGTGYRIQRSLRFAIASVAHGSLWVFVGLQACSAPCLEPGEVPVVTEEFGEARESVQMLARLFADWTGNRSICALSIDQGPVEWQSPDFHPDGSYSRRKGEIMVSPNTTDLPRVIIHELCHAIQHHVPLADYKDLLNPEAVDLLGFNDEYRDLLKRDAQRALEESFAQACELGPWGAALRVSVHERCAGSGEAPPRALASLDTVFAGFPGVGRVGVDGTEWEAVGDGPWSGYPAVPNEEDLLEAEHRRGGDVTVRAVQAQSLRLHLGIGPPNGSDSDDLAMHGVSAWRSDTSASLGTDAAFHRLVSERDDGLVMLWALRDGTQWTHIGTRCRPFATAFVAGEDAIRFDVVEDRISWTALLEPPEAASELDH